MHGGYDARKYVTPGEAATADHACLSRSLYRHLVDGLEVSVGEVDAAVRLAQGRPGRHGVEEVAGDELIIRAALFRPSIRPRST